MVSGHHNHLFDAAVPAGKPVATADYYYDQDLARDFWYLLNQAGKLKSMFNGYPVLVDGGEVIAGAGAWQVNISALIALLDYAIQVPDGDIAWANPPVTKAETITAILSGAAQTNLDIHTGGDLNPTADGATTNYLWVKYSEAAPANATRPRARGAGSYSYEYRPVAAFGAGPVSPAGDATKVLLSTFTITAGGVITFLTQKTANQGKPGSYDLIIDSDAKLDLWCQATHGEYKRVYIKSGTYTPSAFSPNVIGGIIVDLDAAGTVEVYAEKGATILWNGAYAGFVRAVYHLAAPTYPSSQSIENLTLDITNAGLIAIGFWYCVNLKNCKADITGESAYGFSDCDYCVNCHAITNGTDNNSYGFNSCDYLDGCTANCTGLVLAYGFISGYHAVNCQGIGIGVTNGDGKGFFNMETIFGCQGKGTGAGAGVGVGFDNCDQVIACEGQGLNPGAGNGYGFRNSRKLQQNRPLGASKTATYNTAYADAVNVNAAADTAAGGYNS